jgi:hypothetical protein
LQSILILDGAPCAIVLGVPRILGLVIAVLLTVFATSCRRSSSSPMGSQVANQRLHDHIIQNNRKVHVEHLGREVLWSDSAIFERAEKFPPPIQELIDKLPGPADASIGANAMVQFLQDVDRRRAEWHPGTIKRKGTGDFECEIGDGPAAILNCVYVSYLEARYPKGRFQFKAQYEPVLLLDGTEVRAAIMPVKF